MADYLRLDKERSIRAVLKGISGEITVNGKNFNGQMVPLNYLPDEDIANVLTYVRNSFGNSGDAVSLAEVRRIRSEAPPPANPSDKYE
jgi:nitrite reductase (NO-forming)